MSVSVRPVLVRGLAQHDDPDAKDSIEALTRRMAGLCAGAVDPFEVVAGLEADGINDEVAGRYGHPHVFALADDLYRRTERRPAVPAPPPDPWTGQVWRQLLRGVLFGLPGLCYATATPAPARPGESVVLLLSLLLSWSMSQGVAYLAYVRLGQGDRPGAARVMRRGLVAAGIVAPPAVALTGVLLGVEAPVTALALGQCVYLLAATAVLVGGAEPWLLLALLPGAAASTAQLAGAQIRPVVWCAWAVTLAATAGLAAFCTRSSGAAGRPDAGRWRADIAAALPHALFGLLAGGLLTFPAVPTLLGLARPSRATTVAVVALSLSMGCAEWILVGYRRRLRRALLTHGSLRSFARTARAALAAAVARYLAALTALGAAVAVPAGLAGALHRHPAPAAWIVGGHLCLGGAFFVALLLQSSGRSRGRTRTVLIAFTAALTTEAAASLVADPWAVQCTAAALLFGALCAYALVVLAKATPHR